MTIGPDDNLTAICGHVENNRLCALPPDHGGPHGNAGQPDLVEIGRDAIVNAHRYIGGIDPHVAAVDASAVLVAVTPLIEGRIMGPIYDAHREWHHNMHTCPEDDWKICLAECIQADSAIALDGTT